MRVTEKFLAWPSLVMGLAVPCLMDCAAAKTGQDLASGCDELSGGEHAAIANLSIDGKFKAFVQATADLLVGGSAIKGDVKTACADLTTTRRHRHLDGPRKIRTTRSPTR